MDYRVISIGTLSRHELWGEKTPVRSAHATTVLVRSGDQVILVDPGLPAEVMAHRLPERSGVRPDEVTDVFLTSFRPAHRRGLALFDKATWYISEMEREAVGSMLVQMYEQEGVPEAQQILEQDIAILKQVKPAPDRLAQQVDLFPLPGFTPGTCGLLLLHMNTTALVAGDAIATQEHLEHGQVLTGGYDTGQARESFSEAIEIADLIIPGHDNLVINPTRRTL